MPRAENIHLTYISKKDEQDLTFSRGRFQKLSFRKKREKSFFFRKSRIQNVRICHEEKVSKDSSQNSKQSNSKRKIFSPKKGFQKISLSDNLRGGEVQFQKFLAQRSNSREIAIVESNFPPSLVILFRRNVQLFAGTV